MTDEELAAMEAGHRRHLTEDGEWCYTEGVRWPCDASKLFDEVRRLLGLVASQPTKDRATEQDRVERMQLDLICGALIEADIARTTDFPGAEERRDIFDLNRQAKALLQRINNVASPGFFPAATEEPTTSDDRIRTQCRRTTPHEGHFWFWNDPFEQQATGTDFSYLCPGVASPTPDEAGQ